jgi:hypothetical protein
MVITGPNTDVQDPALGVCLRSCFPWLHSILINILQTTIMAVEYDGGVIMGADSRTSTGSYIANRVSDKITFVHDKIYVCRSGYD